MSRKDEIFIIFDYIFLKILVFRNKKRKKENSLDEWQLHLYCVCAIVLIQQTLKILVYKHAFKEKLPPSNFLCYYVKLFFPL